MAAPVIQIRRGAFSALPTLRNGEPGFTTDKSDLYVGFSSSNQFFGSARYWTRETTTVGSSVKVVEGSNNGTNFIALKSPDTLSQDYTYTLPSSYGSNGNVLQSDGNGGLTWVNAGSNFTGLTIREEGTTLGTASSVTTINFVGEGITATATGTGATITVNAASTTVAGVSSYTSDFYFINTYQVGIVTATSSVKGIASFNSTDFYLTSGAVGINTESIQDMVGSAISAGINTNITVVYDDANNRINHNVNTATTSTLGVASFNATDFYVTAGAVGINTESIQDMIGTAFSSGITTNITFTYDDAANRLNANVNTATTSTLGVASFNATDFYVTAGAVGINTESIQDMVGAAITAGVAAGINTNVTVTYDDANNRIGVGVNTATTSTLGVASFNSANFSVTNGAVSIANNAVGLGTNTSGQYAKTVIGGNGLTATTANADDGTDYTIDVNVGAGITIASDAVAFRNAPALSSNTVLKWDSTNTQLVNSIITDNGTTATVTGNLTVTGTLTGTASTATSATRVDVTAATSQTGNVVFATAGVGTALYADTDVFYDSSANRLNVGILSAFTDVRTGIIRAADGTSAISIASTTGAIGISSDLTVSGNLYVAGNTTQVNTTSLVVEDRLIELGKVQGTAPTDTTWDLGILFNYYTASSNKKASVYWEGGVSRFLFASDVTESVLGLNLPDTGAVGLGTTTPQLTSPTYAPIEVKELWISDTAGISSAVISYQSAGAVYSGSVAGRYLQDIIVDGGLF